MNAVRLLGAALTLMGCGLIAGASMRGGAADEDVEFSEEERATISRLSPLSEPPADTTNRLWNDSRAARLGQFLFFDDRFSANRSVSCATCHDPHMGFGDGRRLSMGIRRVDRHAQSLWNVAYNRWYFWDGRADSLWSQALVPLEHEDEMGGDRTAIALAIVNDGALRRAYERTFGRVSDLSDRHRFPSHAKPIPNMPTDPRHVAWERMRESDREAITRIFVNVGKALAAYQARIVSRDSPFDRFAEGLRTGDKDKLGAISDSAKRGLKTFIGRGNCVVCHSGANFSDGEFHSVGPRTLGGGEPTDAARYAGIPQIKSSPFHSAGAYSDDPHGPASKRLAALINPSDNWGQFKTPSLRSVATSPPYMHQGQYLTLDEVIEHYSSLSDAGPGGLNHHRERILQPLNLSDREKQDLKAFLESLTGAALPQELVRKPDRP